jgi:hypothetical protein
MSDTINNIERETWISIKDASDLLNISERQAWNIITMNGIETKKLLNKSRKKTYIKYSDIEQYYKNEQERTKLKALKARSRSSTASKQASPLSAISEISALSETNGEFEISESGNKALSERAKSYLELINDLKTKQEALQKSSVKWKVSALWISILCLVIVGLIGLYLHDTKQALSEREIALSESRKALSEMTERAFSLSEKEKEAIFALSEREAYIQKLILEAKEHERYEKDTE